MHVTIRDLARVTRPDRVSLPRRFEARERVGDLEVELLVNAGDGRPYCEQLTVSGPEGVPLTAEGLRTVPLARLVREAAAMVAMRHAGTSGEGVTRLEPPTAEEAEEVEASIPRARRRGKAPDDNELRQVAALYREAVEVSFAPTYYVADKLGTSRSTAARMVREARRRKLLGDALPGRAGEG